MSRVFSLALVCGGAVGNLLDRIRSTSGVVDFIDVGLRESRWPTFNVADASISFGALLLAYDLIFAGGKVKEPTDHRQMTTGN